MRSLSWQKVIEALEGERTMWRGQYLRDSKNNYDAMRREPVTIYKGLAFF
jgi:hypothetical protein